MENTQVKNSFDRETVRKIIRGGIITATGAFGIYVLGILGQLNYGSVWTPIVAMIIPILVNAIREFKRGI